MTERERCVTRARRSGVTTAALLSAVLATGGCYRSHGLDPSATEPRDAGPVQRDALVPDPPDAFVPRLDAGPPRCFVDERSRAGFADPQPELSPNAPTVLDQGTRVGQLRLVEVRVARAAVAGNYTVEALGGGVTLFREGAAVGSSTYDELATILGGLVPGVSFSFPGALELGVSSAAGEAPLSGLPALFDGERVLRVSPPTVIREGLVSGPFVVGPIEVDPRAPPGDYRLTGEHAGDTITVDRDGVPVGSVTYSWRETIGGSRVHVFDFEGLFSIEIGNSHPGTHNLHRLEDWIFDGRDVLRISCR